MCDPADITKFSLATTGLQAGAGWQQARYEQNVAKQNEALINQQIEQVGRAGTEEYNQIIRKGREVQAEQRAIMGASGIDPGVGESLRLLADTGAIAQADASTALQEREAQVNALKTEKNYTKSQRKNSQLTAPLALGSTLATGGIRAYGIYRGLT